jgi:hypothetical protein
VQLSPFGPATVGRDWLLAAPTGPAPLRLEDGSLATRTRFRKPTDFCCGSRQSSRGRLVSSIIIARDPFLEDGRERGQALASS